MKKPLFGRMLLPLNMRKNRVLQEELFTARKDGKLEKIYLFFCERMSDLGMTVDLEGKLFLEDQKMNLNAIWLLLRRDFENAGFRVSKGFALHVVERGLEKMHKDAHDFALKQGSSVKVCFTPVPESHSQK